MSDPVTIIQSVTLAANSLVEFFVAVGDLVPRLISAAAIISAFFPPPDKDSWRWQIHSFVNLLAFNIKHAANHSIEDKN